MAALDASRPGPNGGNILRKVLFPLWSAPGRPFFLQTSVVWGGLMDGVVLAEG